MSRSHIIHPNQLPSKLRERLRRIADLKKLSQEAIIAEAVHQYVVNNERFVQAFRRKETRDLNRQIYSYCPLCLGQISIAYTRRKENRKTKRIKVGYFCHPCNEFFTNALSIVEVRKQRNPDSRNCEICQAVLNTPHGLSVHRGKMHGNGGEHE